MTQYCVLAASCSVYQPILKSSPFSPDMSCIHLNVSGTYLPRECSGEYLLTDTISYDRPVYKHTGSGLYMYHGRWSLMCNVWAIGPDIGSDVALMYTYDGAINPLLITTNWTLTEKGMVTVDKTTNAREDTSVNIECLGRFGFHTQLR